MNELFLICPFSQSEAVIRENINPAAYFLTSSAGVFRFKDADYIESIVSFIKENNITRIYVTASTDCRFAKRALKVKDATDFYADRELLAVYKANQSEIDAIAGHDAQLRRLLELHLDNQQAQLIEILAAHDTQKEVMKLVLSPAKVRSHQKQAQTA